MAFKFVILILPVLGSANIDIELSVKLKDVTLQLILFQTTSIGTDVSIITDTEIQTFNVSENNIKNAANSLFGKMPDNVYLRGPILRQDIHYLNNWQQVTRTLKPQYCHVLKISSESKVIERQIIKNDLNISTTIDVGISHDVQNTVSSTWSTEGRLSISQNIKYSIKAEIVKLGREISFYHTSAWGKNTKKSQNTKIGAMSYLGANLEPGQTVVSQLYATKRRIQFQMEYEAGLSGLTVVTYNNDYTNYNIQEFNISDCMNALGLSNSKMSREVIDFEFYVDSKIVVYNQTNGVVLLEAIYN